MIQVQALTKSYTKERPAISSLNFEIKDGEIVGFVGLNGAGKTTTIRIASGVTLPSSGTVLIDGHDIVREKPQASKYIGWVPEFPNFEQNAKAKNLMLYFAGFRGIERGQAEKIAGDLLQRVSLSGFEKKKLRTFSQGMKKRFSLALALLPDPGNFLFDEILNGLDPEGIHFMRSLMIDLKKRGKAVLLSSHILSEIEAMADRVVFIHSGRIVQVMSRDELSQIGSSGGELKIVIKNLNEGALEYLRTLGEVSVVQDRKDTVILSKFTVDPTQISTELVRRGYLIGEFTLGRSSLEEYFFKIVGVSPADVGTPRN